MAKSTQVKPIPSQDEYYDLGTYTRAITTVSSEAQIWFDRGLIWSYGFHHEEAAHCFEQAAAHDPACAMACWGLAYCLGPNYNKPWEALDAAELDSTVEQTHQAVQQAKQHATTNASPVEQALVRALQYRYHPEAKATEDFSIWNQQYADAMKKVYEAFPSDLDIATLYADSLMNLTPWALWDLSTGEPASGAHTLEIKSILDTGIALPGGDNHPGLLHLYIHLMEMSPSPSSALPVANKLRGLVPDSGHLNHMPTHLDILVGDYENAMIWNAHAMTADEKYLARNGPLNFYTLYRCHDYHFRIYAAMFAGNFSVAMSTVEKLESTLPASVLRVGSFADWLESFLSVRVHVLIRFGKWDELLLPSPILPPSSSPDINLYSSTLAFYHYGRAIALTNLHNPATNTNTLPLALSAQTTFHTAILHVPPTRTLFNNKTSSLLAIASSMLSAELSYRQTHIPTAFSHLHHAIQLSDTLPYDEPWGWMQPVRHALGALLLEQGQIEEAEKVYAADLGFTNELPVAMRHPGNIWGLVGWEECVRRLGRGKEVVEWAKREVEKAREKADVKVVYSCFCRRGKLQEMEEGKE